MRKSLGRPSHGRSQHAGSQDASALADPAQTAAIKGRQPLTGSASAPLGMLEDTIGGEDQQQRDVGFAVSDEAWEVINPLTHSLLETEEEEEDEGFVAEVPQEQQQEYQQERRQQVSFREEEEGRRAQEDQQQLIASFKEQASEEQEQELGDGLRELSTEQEPHHNHVRLVEQQGENEREFAKQEQQQGLGEPSICPQSLVSHVSEEHAKDGRLNQVTDDFELPDLDDL